MKQPTYSEAAEKSHLNPETQAGAILLSILPANRLENPLPRTAEGNEADYFEGVLDIERGDSLEEVRRKLEAHLVNLASEDRERIIRLLSWSEPDPDDKEDWKDTEVQDEAGKLIKALRELLAWLPSASAQ